MTRWKNEAKANGTTAPTRDNADTWSTQDKFLIVVEIASMNESELAEYARKKGLYVEQIKSWKDVCMNANGGVAKEAAKLNRNLKDSQRKLRNSRRSFSEREKLSQKQRFYLFYQKKQMQSGGDPEEEK